METEQFVTGGFQMHIVYKHKKGQKFSAGNLECNMTWNLSGEYDKMKPHHFIKKYRINSLKRKQTFCTMISTDEYIPFNEFCHKMNCRLTELDKRKIMRFVGGKSIWCKLLLPNNPEKDVWCV
jgi:hypothetical protein